MPFFGQSQLKKHTPKSLKLNELYKDTLNGQKDFTAKQKNQIADTLSQQGHSSYTINKIIQGKDINIKTARDISSQLAKSGIKDFENDSRKMVNKYLRQEATKKKNIAGRRSELMQESLQEDIYQSKSKNSISSIGGSKPKTSSNVSSGPKLKF